MPWTTPKTDWAIQPRDQYGRYNGDWFNWQDYERIRENILYLAEEAKEKFETEIPIVRMWSMDELVVEYPEYTGCSDETNITDQQRYACPVVVEKQINPIEVNLDVLVNNTFRPDDYPNTKTWVENGHTPTFDDINRWETCCQIVYDIVQNTQMIGKKLPFTVSGGALSGV